MLSFPRAIQPCCSSAIAVPIRSYATGTPRKHRLGPTLSLDHFLQRARVLAFYRTILRGTRRISDPTTRRETRAFARAEFERRRGVTDMDHVRYLLSTGKTEWEAMERYIDGM
ncbi:complex 1 LYR protein [Xylariaceae sp. FL0594]|nr:complex 1 LYR protein [Xylariaceae sp. FL0594]